MVFFYLVFAAVQSLQENEVLLINGDIRVRHPKVLVELQCAVITANGKKTRMSCTYRRDKCVNLIAAIGTVYRSFIDPFDYHLSVGFRIDFIPPNCFWRPKCKSLFSLDRLSLGRDTSETRFGQISI